MTNKFSVEPRPSLTEKPVTLSATKNGARLLDRLLTPKEAAFFLRVSTSWLAKARMNGNGPPFVKVGRSVRYSEAALREWMRAHQRLSTSEP